MINLLVHLDSREPIVIDVDELPDPRDSAIIGKNPRDRTDREVDWLEDGVSTVILPWWRINFIQVLPSPEDEIEFPMPFRTD